MSGNSNDNGHSPRDKPRVFGDKAISKQTYQEREAQANQRTKEALDRSLQITAQTEETAGNTLQALHSQGKQLEHIDQTLHETDQQLKVSEHKIRGMKSVLGSANWGRKGPTSDQYVSPTENEAKRTVKKGYLNKRGSRNPASKRRYVLLCNDKKLYYYSDENKLDDTHLKGMIDLEEVMGNIAEQCNIDKKYVKEGWFFLQTKSRKWWLQASDEAEAIDWVNCIHSCARGEYDYQHFKKNNDANTKSNSGNSHQTQQQQQSNGDQDETDEKLGEVLRGVKRIHGMAGDMNAELNRQEVLLDSIEDKMDRVDGKMKQQSRDMKKIT